jgi:hypothetical protein
LARKLRAVQVSDHFQAILGCLLGEDWTTPRLVEMVITPDGHLLGRCDGEAAFQAFLGASEDLLKNVHGVAEVAGLDGDEIGFLVAKVAEIKRRKWGPHLETVMDNLKELFEDVADWCERHLEAQRGREVGMTFGAMLRAYGRLAKLPTDPDDPEITFRRRLANEKAEELLLALSARLAPSTRFIFDYSCPERPLMGLAELTSMTTNMTYDTWPHTDRR